MKTFIMYITILVITSFIFLFTSFEIFVVTISVLVLFGLMILEEKATEILDKLNKLDKE